MTLFERLTKKAQEHPQRLVLPESKEPRTLKAAERILADKIANIIFLGNKEGILAEAEKLGLSHIAEAEFHNPDDTTFTEKYAELFCELRKKKGVTLEDARYTVKNPLYLGCLLIKAGDADAMVAGALSPTSSVLRAAFQVLKTKPGISVVSGAFIMLLPDNCIYGEDHMLVFADCAVVPDPTKRNSLRLLSPLQRPQKTSPASTPWLQCSVSQQEALQATRKLTKCVRQPNSQNRWTPTLKIDGELQSDAAIVPSVGELKAPDSKVAGHANTLVFPSLETGNIAYKLVQRISGAGAVGPILQGLAAPVNDLSRGATVDDIVNTIIVTCNQAIGDKNL